MSAESANPRGKAVEMFSDILAEIREYGEGFIIVDQVPAKLAPDVAEEHQPEDRCTASWRRTTASRWATP